jgi:hypothetical protein
MWNPGAQALLSRRAPSYLWLGAEPLRFGSLHSLPAIFRLIPVRRKIRAWDCKVTPASCACQEGNTTGCIPNNGGLGAGVRDGFSTPRKTCWFKIWCGARQNPHFLPGCSLTSGSRRRREARDKVAGISGRERLGHSERDRAEWHRAPAPLAAPRWFRPVARCRAGASRV